MSSRVVGAVAERLADAPDVHVDDPLVAEEVEAPHLLEQLAAGQHASRGAGEGDEQVELERAERDGLGRLRVDLTGADDR